MKNSSSSNHDDLFEWIPYNQFSNIKKTEIGNYGSNRMYSIIWKDGNKIYHDITYSAIWENGSLYYEEEWKRSPGIKVTLKYSNYDTVYEFLNEV